MSDIVPEQKEFNDDVIQPFQLESSNLRGRIVKIGPVLNDILNPHNYPKPVAHLVAENALLSLLLSSMLKYEGIFTLQTKGNGPISMMVADVTSKGALRACANYDEDRLQHARESLEGMRAKESSQNNLAQYLGKGYLAFTVDQDRQEHERYQGIVELQGASMVDCVQHYFAQSEQIGTGIKMAVGQRGNQWRGAGILLQKMPEQGGLSQASNTANLDEDDWRRAMILLDSCTEDEFLDEELHPHKLLMRLFHEEGVRVYDPQLVYKECRCTLERVESILAMMPPEERDYLRVDNRIVMHCEFCGKDYSFDDKAITAILKARKKEFSDGKK